MEILPIVFLSVAFILIVILVMISLSPIGLYISEIGLWFSWIPLGMIIASISFLIKYLNNTSTIDFIFLLISDILNLITIIRLLIPFFSIAKTNRKFQQEMKKSLGEEYLTYIDPSIPSRVFREVKFRFSHYISGSRNKHLEKNISMVEGLVYKEIDDEKLELDVCYPKRTGKFPVILFIHGGGWMRGSKDQKTNEKLVKLLANYGYVVFNANYRLTPSEPFLSWKKNPHEHPTIREMVSDIRAALIYTKLHAMDYNGDRNSFFLFGRSAGAHLALLTAFSCDEKYFEIEGIKCSVEDQKVEAVIAFYPITDMLDLFKSYEDSKHLRLPIYRSTGGPPEEIAEAYNKFSPVNYINEESAKRIPPVFLAAGKLDKLITVNQSLELHQELDKYKVPNVFLEFPWANHAFDLVLNGPGGQLAYKYLSQFLVWVLSQRKIKQIEDIAMNLGMKKMISYEKIKLMHKLNESNEDPNSDHVMNYLKEK